MDNLNTETLGSCHVPIPPLVEQHAIVAHVARMTAALDALREATNRSICLLVERRAALIGAAVTGQMSPLPCLADQ
jgi:type I restriction enzyme S subunit